MVATRSGQGTNMAPARDENMSQRSRHDDNSSSVSDPSVPDINPAASIVALPRQGGNYMGFDANATYLLGTLLGLPPGSPLHLALSARNLLTVLDILFLNEADVNELEYTPEDDPNGESILVPKRERGLMHAFQGYIYYREEQEDDIDMDDLPGCVTKQQFNKYRGSGSFLTFINKTKPSPLVKNTTRTAAQEFRKGRRRDPTRFPTFKADKQWDQYNRNLVSSARAQGLSNVLNSAYKPIGKEAKELFQEEQAYMYDVFVQTLETDLGKTLVRKYESTYDAQSIYAQLKAEATQSVSADMEASDLLAHLTTVKLDDTWQGTREAFILNWQDCFRRHNIQVPLDQVLSPATQFVLLSNAVSTDKDLVMVK